MRVVAGARLDALDAAVVVADDLGLGGFEIDRAARLQQQELETRTATLTSLLEPLLLLVMGAVVLLIVLAVMQPIIEINTLMR